MQPLSVIVLGGAGLVGSAVTSQLRVSGHSVIPVERVDYPKCIGVRVDVVVNCNGNSYRFRANQDPRWDFDASVATVERSLFDITAGLYIYVSTVDVYDVRHDPEQNHERCPIHTDSLDAYGFHKWLAERLVEKFARRWFILRLGTVIGPGLKKGPLFDLLHGCPLFMSLDSVLTLIDTKTIAHVIEALMERHGESEIFNVTGTGSVLLRDLAALREDGVRLAPGAEKKVYQYHVDNTKLKGLLSVPSSFEIGRRFLEDNARSQS
jgi:nucleoside-diphosphate-sugar epimerase